ncbi:MAG: diguanylate cyclase [Solirubrobacteraceae bacterium]
MSFRTRLTLFFVLIVIVPMLSAALAVFQLISDNENGKADARLAAAQSAARGLYREDEDDASAALKRVGPGIAEAVRDRDAARVRKSSDALARTAGLTRLTITMGGETVVDIGRRSAIAPASRDFVGSSGKPLVRMQASTATAGSYARRLRRLSPLDVIVRRGSRTLAASGPSLRGERLPEGGGTIGEGRNKYKVASFQAPDFGGGDLRIAVLSDSESINAKVRSSRDAAVGALLGFLILAFAFGIAVSRSLQGQIGRFLDAARRLGRGDFKTRVPTDGHDEFAALGEEFNKMSHQLETRLEELGRERQRLETSIRRIGDTFASNLDRAALLDIVVRTAVDGIGASCGRASITNGEVSPSGERAQAGNVGGFEEVLGRAEQQATERGAPAEVTVGGRSALALALRPSEESGRRLGLISVARADRAFTQGERDLFNYLTGQAAVSVENVELHELLHHQALTDDLTGLFNHRHFQEAISREVERARRFDQHVGLIMLDLDNFKQINDVYGHLQGDVVLREVARVLRESSREIDEPARYGGEEMAVALPQTDLAGAYNLAERIRLSIAGIEVARLDGPGSLRVTASLGVAALPENATDKESLMAAADRALYGAKARGRNRTERADPIPGGDFPAAA